MLTDRFERAVLYVIELHRSQLRKGTSIPYVTHLFAVCSLVVEDGGREDEAIAALLHDGPEDQGGVPVLDEIRLRFGGDVADIVEGLSDAMPLPGEAKAPWRERKEAYLRHLDEASTAVLRVSLADKLHNARSILVDLRADGEDVWKRFNAPRAEQGWTTERCWRPSSDGSQPRATCRISETPSTPSSECANPVASGVGATALSGLFDDGGHSPAQRIRALGGRHPNDQRAAR